MWNLKEEAKEILAMMKAGESDEKILAEIEGIIEGIVERETENEPPMRNEGWD